MMNSIRIIFGILAILAAVGCKRSIPEPSGVFAQRRGTNAKTELRINKNGKYDIIDEFRFCVPNKNGARATYTWTETGGWTISGNEIRLIPGAVTPDKRFDMFRALLITKAGNDIMLTYNGSDEQLKKYVFLKKTETAFLYINQSTNP